MQLVTFCHRPDKHAPEDPNLVPKNLALLKESYKKQIKKKSKEKMHVRHACIEYVYWVCDDK